MKKYIIRLLCILIMVIALSSCTFADLSCPEEGVWYCEELRMSINFAYSSDQEGVMVYTDEETVEFFTYLIDYGGRIHIADPDTLDPYLSGKMRYRDEVFYIITDESTYSFFRKN